MMLLGCQVEQSANYNSNNYAYYWQVSASANGLHTANINLAPDSGSEWNSNGISSIPQQGYNMGK
jgi:hypothetical protein